MSAVPAITRYLATYRTLSWREQRVLLASLMLLPLFWLGLRLAGLRRSLPALAARAHWLTVEWLPKYAPELNDIEGVWRDLKAHHLAHQTFADVNALDKAIHHAVEQLNEERTKRPLGNPRISA